VPFPRPDVDIRAPPRSFDDLIDWLERWSYGLVLLEEYSLADIRAAVRAVESAVRAHGAAAEPWVASIAVLNEETARWVRVVRSDHVWFESSLEQFEWFLRVVEGEDHGGHRQALGQYGRVLGEALRRHRLDERGLEALSSPARAGPAPVLEETLIR
jgi:hypothetical protein